MVVLAGRLRADSDQGPQPGRVRPAARVVEGPGLERRHRVFGAAEGGDYGHRRLAVVFGDVADGREAVAVGRRMSVRQSW